ncbi:MDR family MFS transporter [Propionicicella superfundia]|uniref:MDR family MFS transporter n=1 Tax=Propionicicella superfundia TaxID=348582 RepID=UPI00040B604D|nr:DHA2 family efflux MFS transporter permease subunit [Propionicicella superfundia]
MSVAVSEAGQEIVEGESRPLMSKRQVTFVIYGLMAGMFLSSLDQTIVGTAIRTIGDDLHGLDQQAWVTTAYLISATVTTPLYGKLSDLFGRRPLFLLSISIFIAGSLLSSFSTSMLMLAGFRAFQGLGAGGLMSLPLAIVGDILAPRERAKYQGFFLAVFGVSAVLGPLFGGLFAGSGEILGITGWRWVFLINVPVGIVALLMVFAFLHIPHFARDARPRIDWWGASLVVGTLTPLLLVAEQGREWGWTSVAAIACYAIGGAGLLAFILVERAMGADAIIPIRLFGSGAFSMTTVLSVLIGFGMFGAMLTIPLYLQIVEGLTPTESGFATLPMMAGLMIASIGTGQIVMRTGKYHVFPVSGTLTTSIGFFILTAISIDKPLWFMMIAMFVIGLGLGQLMQTLTLSAQASAPARDIGVATSSATFFRQIGGTLGTAVLLSVLFSVLPGNVTTSFSDKATLTAALDAALDPAVAAAPENQAVMEKMWTPITEQVRTQVDQNLATATQEVRTKVTAAVKEQVSAAVHANAAKGAAQLADGVSSLSIGLDKLQSGTEQYVTGVARISTGAQQLATGASSAATASAQVSSGASQLSTGLSQASSAGATAAREAERATTDFTAVQTALADLSADQQTCQSGDSTACTKLTADQSALQTAMKELGTSVYTTSAYLNGANGTTGLASGLSSLEGGAKSLSTGTARLRSGLQELSTGASQLASGASTAASAGTGLSEGAAQAASGSRKLTAGATQLSQVDKVIDQKVAELTPAAFAKALQAAADEQHLSVVDGRLAVDWSDPAQRAAIVEQVAPKLIEGIGSGDGTTEVQTDTSDTSFLNGADARLTRPFMVGFTQSVVTVYWIGLGVMLAAFVLTWFFRVPPLRSRSALEERAEAAGRAGDGPDDPVADAAADTGAKDD